MKQSSKDQRLDQNFFETHPPVIALALLLFDDNLKFR